MIDRYKSLVAFGFAFLLVPGLGPSQSAHAAHAAPASPGTSEHRGPAASAEGRIVDLHKRLHITPAQEPQFKAFTDVMRANAESMQSLFEQRAQHRDRTAPGMLHWYAQLASAHAEAVNKLVPLFDALYQTLSDKQKKAADVVFQDLRQARPPHRAG
jgi:hypothetical protein